MPPRNTKAILDVLESGQDKADGESLRKIYVAVSCAERLLVIAVPKSQMKGARLASQGLVSRWLNIELLAMTEEDGRKTRVRVHQLVRSLQGDVLSGSEVLHVFTLNSGLIAAMNLGVEADPTAGPCSQTI